MKTYLLIFLSVVVLASCKKSTTNNPTSNDKLRISLTTSIAAYDAAALNTWVPITGGEYGDLISKVSGTGRYGALESLMATIPNVGWSANYTIGADISHTKIPAGNYIIALSVKTGNDSSLSTGSKLKSSVLKNSGYVTVGNELPNIGKIPPGTRVYFLLKTPDATVSADSYVGMYNSSFGFVGSSTSGTTYYLSGDNQTPTTADPSTFFAQVISTPTKQW